MSQHLATKFFIFESPDLLMATKRKITTGVNSPAVSSPAVSTSAANSPAVRTPTANSPAVRTPVVSSSAAARAPDDEYVENENEEDLNMSDDEEGGTRIGDIYIPPPVKPYCSTESIGPRLIITKISNNNFKSYAGEVVLGPFSNCFHAIIGPNGSGKSNVIDSMLFVFGYTANKIRCKKLSVLIHKSSAHENISSCSVAVHFASTKPMVPTILYRIPRLSSLGRRSEITVRTTQSTIGECISKK
ncbi:hypothetical protein HA402_005167 [Bradysia odoriphaga]|nr:hypothetical protein HA402_005167 [Bradysia odoriphaga]